MLKVTWTAQDKEHIPKPPNNEGKHLQVALHRREQKLFIPGNQQGHGFKLTKDNIQHFGKMMNALNDRPMHSPDEQKLRGLCPIPSCGSASQKDTIGAVHLVMEETHLNAEQDPVLLPAKLPTIESDHMEEEDKVHNEPQTEETEVATVEQNTTESVVETKDDDTTRNEQHENNHDGKNQESDHDDGKNLLETQTLKLSETPISQ